jgi:hypothetical protein
MNPETYSANRQRAIDHMERNRKRKPDGPNCKWCGVCESAGAHPANPNWKGAALHAFEAGAA